MRQTKLFVIIPFLLLEAILYYFVLTAGGLTFTVTAYGGIILCFLFALIFGVNTDPWIVAGLACTLGADFCLVVCSPIQQLWGMVFFLAAQILYAVKLHSMQQQKRYLYLRLLLIAVIEVIAIVVLREKLDALAVVSVCYYANLFINIVTSLSLWKKSPLLPFGFIAFILCDTVIGLQVAAGGYLPIPEGSALHSFLFMDFNLSWFFYLPSQVLIALSVLPKEDNG